MSERFRYLVLSTLNQAATKAVASSRKFDARKSLYELVQCTPDLTRQDCLRCLKTSINQLPTERIGARLILPSCGSRYELYPFYNESAV
ncbi:hypothetical protein Bca52824_016089 [Brassica carinata]|uniref:Gnk2-homologous domain-containing protein n=1 Tax=Brassica carinata TaxID=52824 RepID=A0A8X7W3V1_BRACI|nr:hypothetical protein Bca52824_016089 [Brassica carinata]